MRDILTFIICLVLSVSPFLSSLLSVLPGTYFSDTGIPVGPKIAYADGWSLAGSNSATGTVSVAMPITDVQVTGGTTTTVPVKLRVTSGSLSMATTTGITFSGASSGSTIYFSGTRTDVNTALASLSYTRGSTGTDTLEVSLVNSGEVFFTDNNHLYEYVSYTGDWNAAKTQAEARTKYGATGYLTTIGSQSENDFVAARLLNAGWMGAADSSVEGAWRWVTGPESGTQFWSGASGGSTVGGNYANWGTGEPNDAGANEDCAQFLTGGTGKWNDLPCSGTTLPGYVVEYGASGNLPTVTAKNVSIATLALPTVSSFSPTDNATNVNTSANLVITFSQAVTPGSGTVTIWNADTTSVGEIILASSTNITGSGTTIITIDPTSDLLENTNYYVTVDSSSFKNGANAYYSGTGATTTWSFRTGDFTAPALTDIQATSTASTTLTFTWTTDEAGSSFVSYDPNPFLIREITAETDTSSRVTSHTVTVSDLVPCTWYRYRVHSKDAAGNTATSSFASAYTSGCTGDTTIKNLSATDIDLTDEGSASAGYTSNLTILTPAHFYGDASSTIAIQIAVLDSTGVLTEISKPNGKTVIGADVFDVKALLNGTDVLDSFDLPVTLTFEYEDADIAGIDESTLNLYHYHLGTWSMLSDCVVDTSANTVTCTTDGFSIFGLFGSPIQSIATNPTGSGGGVQYGCRDTKAQNYSAFVSHKPALCVYANSNQSSPMTNTISKMNDFGPMSPGSFTIPQKDLYLGIKDKNVITLQQLLNNLGFTVAKNGPGSAGNETEIFGTNTKKALIKFQTANHIYPAVGFYGPKTRTFIFNVSSKK